MQVQSQSQEREKENKQFLVCPACRTRNRPIAKFCKECGEIINNNQTGHQTSEEHTIDWDSIVGHEKVKEQISNKRNRVIADNERKKRGLPSTPLYLHSVFMGDTGTGKTMMGRYFAEEFHRIGVLSKGTFLEIDNEIIKREGQNISSSINKWIDKARGGILFFDEMHRNTEAITTIINSLETTGEDIIIIIAGMKDPLNKYFEENREEKQRILLFDLEDYSADELLKMTLIKLSKSSFHVTEVAVERLGDYIESVMYSKSCEYKNGWLVVREVIPKVLNLQSKRLAESGTFDEESLILITDQDIPDEGVKKMTPEEVIASMDDLVGMEDVKEKLKGYAHAINIREEQRTLGIKGVDFGIHIVFTGNPGTGKTTIARILGKLLKAIGYLPSGHIVETDRNGLVSEFIGGTAPKTSALIDSAMGGILFIDEAYSLIPKDAGKDYGQEAVDTILKRMEDSRGKFVVIAAGYKNEMDRFIKSNPGLKGRFTDFFNLPDYKPHELHEIFKIMVKNAGYTLSEEAARMSEDVLKEMYDGRDQNFGNGRDVRSLFEKTAQKLASRLSALKPEERLPEKLRLITLEDIDYKLKKKPTVEDILSKLDSMVGMDNIKKEIWELVQFTNMQMKRESLSGKGSGIVPHIILTGNPGTGKTTVARKLGEIFHTIGILPSSRFVEVDKAGLIASYVGQTSEKVNRAVDSAMGGVLFIDEAYGLTPSDNGDSFKQDAIDTLVKRMSDDKGKFIVIAAGYRKEMDLFLKSNSGLASRFQKTFNFEDYEPRELSSIFQMMSSGEGFSLSESAKQSLSQVCNKMYQERGERFGNGRDISNLFDEVRQKQTVRLTELEKNLSIENQEMDDSLYWILEAEDFPVDKKDEYSLDEALAGLDRLIGLGEIKKEIRELIDLIRVEKLRNPDNQASKIGSHYIFTGNPGTGKTTVARILAGIFKHMGILSKGHLVEVDREGLVAGYVGQTATKTAAVIDSAMGGVLFIDEAYALADGGGETDFGKEAIDTILKRMEDSKGKFIVIAAGYRQEMQRFLNSNTGLPSRFQNFIEFPDYKPDELSAIFAIMARSNKMIMTEKFKEKLNSHLAAIYSNRDENFANGRTVRNLFEKVRKNQASRIAAIPSLEAGDPALYTLEEEDLK